MHLKSVDIHNHLLPGVDDGFATAEESLEAIRRLLAAGVGELVFTPHINPDVYPQNDEDRMRQAYGQFLPLLPDGLKTSLAAEYMICGGFEKELPKRAGGLLCYDDRSVLVEMSYLFRSPNLENALFELQMAGFKPILAHPERYLYMAESLEDFDRLHENGCRFQLNYISFAGVYGWDSVKIIRYLARRGYCDFVATDLHSVHQLERILSSDAALLLRRQFSRLAFKETEN
ncbi:MAG: hypothetical protein MJY80_01375 [Bacteroidales bacterium]|nr:hypothetical protein [Bacteroidales bacterium]